MINTSYLNNGSTSMKIIDLEYADDSFTLMFALQHEDAYKRIFGNYHDVEVVSQDILFMEYSSAWIKIEKELSYDDFEIETFNIMDRHAIVMRIWRSEWVRYYNENVNYIHGVSFAINLYRLEIIGLNTSYRIRFSSLSKLDDIFKRIQLTYF